MYLYKAIWLLKQTLIMDLPASKSTVFSVKIMVICRSICLKGHANQSEASFPWGGKNPKTQQKLTQTRLKTKVSPPCFFRGCFKSPIPQVPWHQQQPAAQPGPGLRAGGTLSPHTGATEVLEETATELSSHLRYLPPAAWKPSGT